MPLSHCSLASTTPLPQTPVPLFETTFCVLFAEFFGSERLPRVLPQPSTSEKMKTRIQNRIVGG
jgi:hypothetical protein